jgi:hypothetical protein
MIYSTATDIASYHGKVVLFTGDCKGTCESIPVVLPPQNAFEWKKCLVLDDRTKLRDWYANNPSEYGKLWDLLWTNGIKVEILVPRMIALPLRAAKLYQDFRGTVMPHKLLAALETHLVSPDTALGNGNNWDLVQRWLLVAAQKDGGNGDWTRSKLFIAFKTDAILTNNNLIHCWISNRLNATLDRRPDPTSASTTVGI